MGEAEPLSETLRVGLLLEAAQTHQRLAQETLEGLHEHARSFDGRLREQINRALGEAFDDLSVQAQQTTAALQRLRRAADARLIAWSAAAMILSAAVTLAAVRMLLPSREQVAALRARRALFAADVRHLREYGGSVDLRRCGRRGRLCVRVDRSGPAYGAHGDFLLVRAP